MRILGLKTTETTITTVKIPTEIRIALKEKKWRIIDAIKNGLKHKEVDEFLEEICTRSECVRAKGRLADLLIEKASRENE